MNKVLNSHESSLASTPAMQRNCALQGTRGLEEVNLPEPQEYTELWKLVAGKTKSLLLQHTQVTSIYKLNQIDGFPPMFHYAKRLIQDWWNPKA